MQKLPLVLSILLAVAAWSTVRTHEAMSATATVPDRPAFEQRLNLLLAGQLFAITHDDQPHAPANGKHHAPANRTPAQASRHAADPAS